MYRPTLLAVSLLMIATTAYGQGHGAMPVSGGVRMAAPVAMARVAPTAGGARGVAPGVAHVPAGSHLVVRNGQIHVRSSGTMVRSTTPRMNRPRPVNTQDQEDIGSNSFPVPGLGFDVPHWAATHPRGNTGRGRHSRQFAAFFPFFDGGFLVAPQPIIEDESSADAQQADYAPQSNMPEPRERVRYREQAEVIPSVNNDEPQRESEQYVFVRRDGTIIFAVAYTWDKGNLRYVTTEGLRRSVTLDSLDLDATRQFNEQRGLSFRLPA